MLEMLLITSISLLWVAMLVNLALTLRIIRWITATNEAQKPPTIPAYKEQQELALGKPAPEFKARTLAGQPVRLDNYIGRSVVFIFVSPSCGHCRLEMPMLLKLAPLAKKNAEVEITLVSDWGPVVTNQWLETMRTEDAVDVTLPILVAPRGKSDFLEDYNPKFFTPSFCLLNAQGEVEAMGTIPSTDWSKLKRAWEKVATLSPFMFNKHLSGN